jgi:hypothetical protein
MTGRLIENHNSNEYGQFKEQLDISKVAPGMYMLNVQTKNNNGKTYRETAKIVKQ